MSTKYSTILIPMPIYYGEIMHRQSPSDIVTRIKPPTMIRK